MRRESGGATAVSVCGERPGRSTKFPVHWVSGRGVPPSPVKWGKVLKAGELGLDLE